MERLIKGMGRKVPTLPSTHRKVAYQRLDPFNPNDIAVALQSLFGADALIVDMVEHQLPQLNNVSAAEDLQSLITQAASAGKPIVLRTGYAEDDPFRQPDYIAQLQNAGALVVGPEFQSAVLRNFLEISGTSVGTLGNKISRPMLTIFEELNMHTALTQGGKLPIPVIYVDYADWNTTVTSPEYQLLAKSLERSETALADPLFHMTRNRSIERYRSLGPGSSPELDALVLIEAERAEHPMTYEALDFQPEASKAAQAYVLEQFRRAFPGKSQPAYITIENAPPTTFENISPSSEPSLAVIAGVLL